MQQRERRFSSAEICEGRKALEMTQEEFAHALGITVSTVNRWENGRSKPSKLAGRAMAALLESRTDERTEI